MTAPMLSILMACVAENREIRSSSSFCLSRRLCFSCQRLSVLFRNRALADTLLLSGVLAVHDQPIGKGPSTGEDRTQQRDPMIMDPLRGDRVDYRNQRRSIFTCGRPL